MRQNPSRVLATDRIRRPMTRSARPATVRPFYPFLMPRVRPTLVLASALLLRRFRKTRPTVEPFPTGAMIRVRPILFIVRVDRVPVQPTDAVTGVIARPCCVGRIVVRMMITGSTAGVTLRVQRPVPLDTSRLLVRLMIGLRLTMAQLKRLRGKS